VFRQDDKYFNLPLCVKALFKKQFKKKEKFWNHSSFSQTHKETTPGQGGRN